MPSATTPRYIPGWLRMTSDDGSCPLARAMRETLDAVVTPVVREALIHDALILAGLGELPQLGDAMRAFTGQHLHAVVARALGDEMAASITEEILLTIGPASLPPSGRGTPQRPSRGPSHRSTHTPFPQSRRTPVVSGVDSKRLGLPPLPRIPTPTVSSGRRRAAPEATWPTASAHGSRPPPPEHGLPRALRDTDPAGELHGRPSQPPLSYSMPFVLVATHDASLLGTLATACGARARVCSVRTPAELVKRLDTLGGARCIVLLDGRSPSLRPAALAVLLEDAPSVDVVFANAEPTAEAFALSVSPSVRRWAVYLEPVSLDQIAAECMRRVS